MIPITGTYENEQIKRTNKSAYIVGLQLGDKVTYFGTQKMPDTGVTVQPYLLEEPTIELSRDDSHFIAGQGSLEITFKRNDSPIAIVHDFGGSYVSLEEFVNQYLDLCKVKVWHGFTDIPFSNWILIWDGSVSNITSFTETTISFMALEMEDLIETWPRKRINVYSNPTEGIDNIPIPVLYGGSINEVDWDYDGFAGGLEPSPYPDNSDSYKYHNFFASHVFPTQYIDTENKKYVFGSETDVYPPINLTYLSRTWVKKGDSLGVITLDRPWLKVSYRDIGGIETTDVQVSESAYPGKMMAIFALYPEHEDVAETNYGVFAENTTPTWKKARPDVEGSAQIPTSSDKLVVGFQGTGVHPVREMSISLDIQNIGSGSRNVKVMLHRRTWNADEGLGIIKDQDGNNMTETFTIPAGTRTVVEVPTTFGSSSDGVISQNCRGFRDPAFSNPDEWVVVVEPLDTGAPLRIHKLWITAVTTLFEANSIQYRFPNMSRFHRKLIKCFAKDMASKMELADRQRRDFALSRAGLNDNDENVRSQVFAHCRSLSDTIDGNDDYCYAHTPIRHMLDAFNVDYITDLETYGLHMRPATGYGASGSYGWKYRRSITSENSLESYLSSIAGESWVYIQKHSLGHSERKYTVTEIEPTTPISYKFRVNMGEASVSQMYPILTDTLTIYEEPTFYNKFIIHYDPDYVNGGYFKSLLLTRVGDYATYDQYDRVYNSSAFQHSYDVYGREETYELKCDWITETATAELLAFHMGKFYSHKGLFANFTTDYCGNKFEPGDVIEIDAPQLYDRVGNKLFEREEYNETPYWQIVSINKNSTTNTITARKMRSFDIPQTLTYPGGGTI